MKPLALAFAAALTLLSVPGAAREGAPRGGPGYANPSAVIAAELAFNQMAQDKGQWTAFRETAAPDAEMFVPQRVNALAWLKRRADPPTSVRWQPHEVWMSCDGSIGVTRGAWQRPNGTGYFTTVWQRQPKRGDYKWVLDQGDDLKAPLAAPEMIAAKVADCPPRALRAPQAIEPVPPSSTGAGPLTVNPLRGPLPAIDAPSGADTKEGWSRDGSMAWRSTVMADGARRFTVWIWLNGGWGEAIDSRVAAPIPAKSG